MNRLRTAAAALAVALVSTLSLAPAPASAEKVLANGGFETGTLSPWTCSGSSGTVVSTPVRTGTKALQATPAGLDNARCTQTVPTVAGTSYTLSAWVRGSYVYLGVAGGASTWTPNSRGARRRAR